MYQGAFSYCCSYENETWETIPLNNERLSLVKTKLQIKNWQIVALNLLPYNISINLRPKGLLKRRLISRIKFFKKSVQRFKNYSVIC